jgi:hypothetical protein
MIVPGSSNPLLLASGAGYQIANSLRFRASNSANAARTNATAGSAQKATFSFWVKRGQLGTGQAVFGTYNIGSNYFYFGFTGADQFIVLEVVTTIQYRLDTTAVFRDPSAWYHIVVAIDTTQATAANRVRIYANGTELTSFSTNSPPALNYSHTYLGANARVNYIGGNSGLGYLDAHLAKLHYIDGQQLTPASFGQTDATTGVWVPKAYTGTYGTLGSLHEFEDATTTTTIVKDTSGNSNNFTASGISVTSGVTFDQMTDTPTLNYAVMNPLDLSGTAATFQWANLQVTRSGASLAQAYSSIWPSSGKWYCEMTAGADVANLSPGIITGSVNAGANRYLGQDAFTYAYDVGGQKVNNGSYTAYGNSWTAGDVIGIIIDADNGKLYFSKNGTVQNSGDPVSGTNAAFTSLTGPFRVAVHVENGGLGDFNFGQRAFSYTPPSGFKALNTANLSVPTIKKPSLYMDATLRTGTGATASVSSLGFQPDLVWIKSRSAATDHGLYDSVRGVQKQIESNTTTGETTETTGLTAFNSNGYTVGSLAQLNTNTATYVDWAWKEGITPGFDIVTYTGNGTNRTISHSLGAIPKFMTVKRLDTGNGWPSYHVNQNASPASGYMYLNSTAGFAAASTMWNSTAPTSSVFSVGTNSETNGNTFSFVAYLWAEIDGYSKFSSYTGNASADGPFVWCGFRPRWIMIKDATATNLAWRIYDTVRETFNEMGGGLEAGDAAAENYATSVRAIDVLSNGFKIRVSASGLNGSGVTFVFAAFAEAPFKYARAR